MSVPIVGPDGRQYEIDEAQLDSVLKLGFRVETPDAPVTALEQATDLGKGAVDVASAATFGALEGATAGGFGAAVGAVDAPELQSAVLRAREESPIATTVGEVAGMIASPVNIPGNALTRAAAATTRLGRIGANITGGAVTGSLFGAGKTVSDAALGDVDLTAEKLLAGAGLGALLGGAGGGVGGAIEEGARAVLPRAANFMAKRAQSALDDIANDATIKATRSQQSVINRLGEARTRAAADAMRAEGVLGERLLSNPDDILKSLEEKISRVGAEKGAVLELAEAGGAKAAHGDLLQRLDDFEKGLNPLQRKLIKGDLQDLREGIGEIAARAQPSGTSGSGFRALDDLRQSVAKRAKFSKGAAGADDETLALKRQLAGTLRDEIDKQLVPQLGSDIGKHWADTKALYGGLKDAATLAKSGTGRAKPGGIGLGLYDLLAGVAGAGIHPLGMAAAYGSKVLREQGPAIVARIADRLAKEPALQAVAKSFAASLPTTIPQLGPFGAVLAQAAAISPENALATHMAHAQLDPSYAATAQLAGLTPEQPDEHPAAIARAQTLAEAQAAAAAQDEAVRKGVDRVVKGSRAGPRTGSALKTQDFGAMRMRRSGAAAYDKRVTEIRELATDPQALIDRITANMGGLTSTAPAVTVAMQATAQRALAYLAQQSAVPPKAGPMAAEWDPPEADKQAFIEKLEVVQEPMSVLDDAAAGTLTEGQMEALRAVWPRVAEQIAQTTLERMVSGGAVPYSQKLMLFMLSGVDPDGSMSPEAVAANQAAIFAAKQPGTPGAPADPNASDVSLAQRTATPSQRREVRDE